MNHKTIIGCVIMIIIGLYSCKKEDLPRGNAFFYPSAFTPNNDVINDYWAPIGGENANVNFNTYHVKIFSKNDILVFETTDYNTQWYGTYKGTYVPSSFYYYSVTYEMMDGNKYRDIGIIELMRQFDI